jgi:hypothetical protein
MRFLGKVSAGRETKWIASNAEALPLQIAV